MIYGEETSRHFERLDIFAEANGNDTATWRNYAAVPLTAPVRSRAYHFAHFVLLLFKIRIHEEVSN